MAKKEIEQNKEENPAEVQIPQEKTTKTVLNRGFNKIELVHNGILYSFPVNQSVEVPMDMNIPNNLGLWVK